MFLRERVFAINIYKNGLLFKGTLACDERCGLLIASPNVKILLVCFQIQMYLIEFLTIINYCN